jgi:nucleoside-diphosphate-sugar epimerase
MKALVTGATGFLGSHIAERLVQRGDSVRALVRQSSDTRLLREWGVEPVNGDVTQPDSLTAAMRGIEAVYHAAAMVSEWDPWRDFQTVTIDGTRNVLQAAAAAGAPRFLHVSTDGVYSLQALKGRITEESPLEKRFGWGDYYRRSKSAAENIAREYAAEGKIGVTIVRPGLLLGERDRAIFPGVLRFLTSSVSTYLGSGDNRLPYVYAGDVAEACLAGATDDRSIGQIYNVVSDERVTQKSLFETVAEATGQRPPKRKLPLRLAYALGMLIEAWCVFARRRKVRPELTRFAVILFAYDYREDASKLRRELGWEPEVPLKEAIGRCVRWHREHEKRPAGR